MLYKNSFFKKFLNIHRRIPALESLFNKETPTQIFPCECCGIFKSTYFKEHPQTAASGSAFLIQHHQQLVFNFTIALCENFDTFPDIFSPSA